MTPQRWNRVRAIFDSAVDRPPAELEQYLREACEGDEALLTELRQMLGQNEAAGFLDNPVAPLASGFRAGEVVAGRYRIVRELGRGGMGQVYEADDAELHERIALKTLLPEVAADTSMIARFKREIQLARKIGHANVCRVFDLARHPADGSSPNATLFLTMEFLPGETLGHRLEREGRIGPAEALPLLAQMAEALDAAHRAGIIHRDFKPANVMLAGDGRGAVVTDFGLAHSIEVNTETTATKTGQLVGTIDYMAPELFTGSAASGASDVYALGLVAYKMVTGKLPFESESPLAGVVRRAGQRPPSARTAAPDLDPAWDRAFARALDPDPAHRFATCGAFVDALRGNSAPSVTLNLPRLSRGNTWAVGAAALLLLASPFAWRAWQHARSRPSTEAEALYQQGAADLHAGAYFAATKALGQAVTMAPHFTLAHARLAEAWVGLDLTEKATQEMLIVRRQDLSALSRLERLQVEAIDFTITREFARAASKYEEMLRSGPPAPDDVEVDLGRAYENAGKPDQALAEYRKAAEGTGSNAAAWLALAVLYGRRGDQPSAQEAFGKAESIYQSSNNLEGLIEVAVQRGTSASAREQFDGAAKYLDGAFQTAKLAGNTHQEVRVKLALSTNAYRSGDAALAEQYAKEALDDARLNRIDGLAVRGLLSLGSAYLRGRNPAVAEQHYREALAMARSAGSAKLIAQSLLSLAALHDAGARYAESAVEAQEAIGFYDANGYAVESFQGLTALGRALLWGSDDPRRAEAVFQRALTSANQTRDPGLQAFAEESLGTVMTAQERYPEALPHFEKELALSVSEERKGYAGLNCGEMLWAVGRYEEAEARLRTAERSASKFPGLRVRLLRARAEMALSQERYRDAESLSQSALAVDSARDVRTRVELDRILGMALAGTGERSKSQQLCRRAVESSAGIAAGRRARLALAQSQLIAGNRAGVLATLRAGDANAAKYPETGWRMLALLAQASAEYRKPAADALEALEHLWGSDSFRGYLARRDVQRLARPLLPAVPANP